MKAIAMTPSFPPEDGYFLYHSIGQYPGKAEGLAATMAEFAAAWGAPNDDQWSYALKRRERFVDLWRGLINAPRGSLTTCESVTAGMHTLVTALPEGYLRGRRVLVAADCFPSLHFLLQGLAPRLGFTLDTVPLRDGATWVADEDFADRWGRDVGLALLTWVSSTSSARIDLDRLVAHGRAMGSLIVVDITQAAGLLPFDVQAPAVDATLSTSLKWMCGTPGAGILHVRRDLVAECRPELRGWFSQNNPFNWDLHRFAFAPDIRRFDHGTPGIVAALASVPALEWHAKQDRERLVAHNRALSQQIVEGADALGLPLACPREPERRGGSVMLRLPDAAEASALVGALRLEGLTTDSRGPVFRLSPGAVTQAEAIDRLFETAARVLRTRARRMPGRAGTSARGASAEALGRLGAELLSGRVRVVDLSGVLGPDTPLLKLPEDLAVDTPLIEIHRISEYDANGPFWAWNWLKLGEHSGTHFDAPRHWLSGRYHPDGTTDTLEPQRLIAPANVIDCSAEAAADPDFLLTPERVCDWEAEHGEIAPGEWVLMRTDWDRRAHDAALFLNRDADGPHSPGPTAACMDYLLSKGIVGWGTQCIGTDAGQAETFSPPFPAHTYLHRDNCFGLASLARLDELPPKGAILIAAPLKILRGTGSPIRALALVPAGPPAS
jgi:kynurenine formamidase/selenocysteine lyase/cysteine desulfurase